MEELLSCFLLSVLQTAVFPMPSLLSILFFLVFFSLRHDDYFSVGNFLSGCEGLSSKKGIGRRSSW